MPVVVQYKPPDPELARLKARLDTMPVIEQAKGIIMARERCGAEEAFDLLRQASQRANLKVYVLATFLVQQASGHTAEIRPGTEPREDNGRTAASTAEEELTADRRARQPGGQGPAVPVPGTVVVPLPGELTFSNVHEVKSALEAAFGSAGNVVVADGTATVFCDSAGMHELIRAHKHAAATGTAFRVVVPHFTLRDRLSRTGLDAYLAIRPWPKRWPPNPTRKPPPDDRPTPGRHQHTRIMTVRLCGRFRRADP